MNKIRLGILGYGQIVQLVHINNIKKISDIELVAISECNNKNIAVASNISPNTELISEYKNLLRRKDIDAVIIALPNNLHKEASIEAINYGKHIYLEKPIASNLQEARQILNLWSESDVIGMVGFNFRFNKEIQVVKKHLEKNLIGKIQEIKTIFSSNSELLPDWKKSRESGGGALLDLGSHHIDMVHFLTEKKFCEIYADIKSINSEHDTAKIHGILEDGTVVKSLFSINTTNEDIIEIKGSSGKILFDRFSLLNTRIILSNRKSIIDKVESIRLNILSFLKDKDNLSRIINRRYEPSYYNSLYYFINCLKNNLKPKPDFYDGYYTLEVIDKAEESSKINKRVKLN